MMTEILFHKYVTNHVSTKRNNGALYISCVVSKECNKIRGGTPYAAHSNAVGAAPLGGASVKPCYKMDKLAWTCAGNAQQGVLKRYFVCFKVIFTSCLHFVFIFHYIKIVLRLYLYSFS